MLVSAINELNEKGMKYIASQEKDGFTLAFGLMNGGQGTRVEILPKEKVIQVKILGTDKEVDVPGLVSILEKVTEIKALQNKEAELVKSLKLSGK